MALSAGTIRGTRTASVGMGWGDPMYPLLLLVAVVAGLSAVLVSTPLGSGDYGQWLMTARPYAGLAVPDYRAAAAVPPVVPFLLGGVVGVVGDAALAIRLFAALTVVALGVSAYLAGLVLFGSRRTGLLATVMSLLVVQQFLDLLAFGGLLQAWAIVFAWLTIAAFSRAGQVSRMAWAWWVAGAAFVAAAALTHMGTASIIVPAGSAVAVIATGRAATARRARVVRLVPLGVALAVTGFVWLTVLLPGSTNLTGNPASLDYRGPGRLLDSLTATGPAVVVAVGGLVAIVIGTVREIVRRQDGPWLLLATWTAITLTVLMVAVLTGAATDYPRFATPILAPLVIGSAAALSRGVAASGRWLAAHVERGSAPGWTLAMLVALIVASAPLAAEHFMSEANGYRLQDSRSLIAAATWIDSNLSDRATVLAPVREAKWLEGLTGNPSLFSNAFRYSFRAEEWERSLAADTLFRSSGALVNQFFFARLVATGPDQSAASGIVVAANHGGEFIDLLTTVPDSTRILSPDRTRPTLASLANLGPAGREVSAAADRLEVATTFAGDRRGGRVAYRQTVALQQGSSVLDLRASVQTDLPIAGLEMELRPAAGMFTDIVAIDGQEATISFRPIGPGEPRLRINLVGGAGSFLRTASGGLRVWSADPQVRLLITDLTGSGTPAATTQWLDPAQLVDEYNVRAALLARGPSYDARAARMEALGFQVAQQVGPYVILVRPATPLGPAAPADPVAP